MKVINKNTMVQIDLSNLDTNNPDEALRLCFKVINLQEECLLQNEYMIQDLLHELSMYKGTKETSIRTLEVVK